MRAFLLKHLAPSLGIHMSLHLIFLPMYRGSITLHGIQTASVLLAAALQKRSFAASGFHFAVAMTSTARKLA